MISSDREAASDEDLLRLYVDHGDSDSLGALVRRHESRVYGLAYRMMGNRADALDATQEVFLLLVRKARSFQHRSAFTTWLHRLTLNRCRDLLRKRSRTPEPTEELPETGDPPTDPSQRLAVEDALKTLPEDQRAAVVMRDLYGLNYEEIAQAQEVPVGTVKSRIARGRLALAQALEPAADTGRLKDREE